MNKTLKNYYKLIHNPIVNPNWLSNYSIIKFINAVFNNVLIKLISEAP